MATAGARRDIITGKEQAAERVKQDLKEMSRERPLPDAKTLEKVTRYEAQRSRLLVRPHKSWKPYRSGEAPAQPRPPARLDVQGMEH